MTDLHDLDRGFERLHEAHTDGIVVFTESENDAFFYNALIGSGLRRLIRFTAPEGKNKGWYGAVTSCEYKRKESMEKGLPVTRYWCLLDGEEAVRWGRTGFEILTTRSLLFRLDDPAADGILFLNCHEKENLYLLYGSAVEDIRYQLAFYREPTATTNNKSANKSGKINYDAASNQRLKEIIHSENIACRPPATMFGPHNVWQAMTRSLLSAGLHAACKRSGGRVEWDHLHFVSDLTTLERRRGRLFEDAIFSRLGEYRSELKSIHAEHSVENGAALPGSKRPAGTSDDKETARNRVMIDFWRELYSNYRMMKGASRKSIRQDPFAQEWLRICDGKSFMSWIFAKKHKLWEKAYERQLIENGFGGIFRNALLNVLLVEPVRTRARNGVVIPPRAQVRPPLVIRPLSVARR